MHSSYFLETYSFESCNIFVVIIHLFCSLCAGAEHLSQVVYGAIPNGFFHSTALPACELAVHILNYLYKKLNEVCLVQGGEVVKIINLPVLILLFFSF
jgi:gamma-tubulin complex component 5